MPLFPGTFPAVGGATLPDPEDSLYFPGTASTFHVGMKCLALTEDWTFILPNDKGLIGQSLVTDGAGQTSWATILGITTFLGLTDTPLDYVGQAFQALRVNIGEDALEFVPFPVGSGDMTKAVYDSGDNGIVNASETTVIFSQSDGALTQLDPVYISGWLNGPDKPDVGRAEAGDPAKMNSIGLSAGSVGNNASVFIVRDGIIKNVDTTAWSDDDFLYVGSAGGLTNVRPDPATNIIQVMGVVLRSHGSQGAIGVFSIIIDHFRKLVDTPNDYTGFANQFVVVNAGETGLEFSAVAPGGSAAWSGDGTDFSPVLGVAGISAGERFRMISRVADGPTAIGFIYDTENDLTDFNAIVAQWNDFGVRRIEIGKATSIDSALRWFNAAGTEQAGYLGVNSSTAAGELLIGDWRPGLGYSDGGATGEIILLSRTTGGRSVANLSMQTSMDLQADNTMLSLAPEKIYGMRLFDRGRTSAPNPPILGLDIDMSVALSPYGEYSRLLTDGAGAYVLRVQSLGALTQADLLQLGDDEAAAFVNKWSVQSTGAFGPAAYKFPAIDGTSGYVLKTDGGGGVTWQAESAGGGGDPATWESLTGLFQIVPTQIASGDRLYIRSRVVDGAANIAHLLDTEAPLTTTARLLEIQNSGAMAFRFLADGRFGNEAFLFPGSDGTVGQILKTDGAGAVTWQAESPGGVTTFLGLTDTPADYTGQASKVVSVNAGETGLEFTIPASGGPVAPVAVNLSPYAGEPPEFDGAVPGQRSSPDARPTAVFSKAGIDDYLMWTFPVPPSYSGGNLRFTLHWAGFNGATGGTVRWRVDIESIRDGDTDIDGGTVWNPVGYVDSVAPSATQKTSASITGTPTTLPVVGEIMRVRLLRMATDAADTLADSAEQHSLFMEQV